MSGCLYVKVMSKNSKIAELELQLRERIHQIETGAQDKLRLAKETFDSERRELEVENRSLQAKIMHLQEAAESIPVPFPSSACDECCRIHMAIQLSVGIAFLSQLGAPLDSCVNTHGCVVATFGRRCTFSQRRTRAGKSRCRKGS